MKALPDQNFMTSQKRTGLSLPSDGLDVTHPEMARVHSMFPEPFVKPTFVETFFTLLPWDNQNRSEPLDLLVAFYQIFSSTGHEEAYLLRLLSLRTLPQDNPCWSDAAKAAFDDLLHKVLDCVSTLK